MTDPKRECRCSPNQISKSRQRIYPDIPRDLQFRYAVWVGQAGPLLDRADLHVEVLADDFKELSSAADGEPSGAIRSRAGGARGVQAQRFGSASGADQHPVVGSPTRIHSQN